MKIETTITAKVVISCDMSTLAEIRNGLINSKSTTLQWQQVVGALHNCDEVTMLDTRFAKKIIQLVKDTANNLDNIVEGDLDRMLIVLDNTIKVHGELTPITLKLL